MAEQSLAEQVQNEIKSLQTTFKDLQSSVRMSTVRDSVEDLGSSIKGLDRRIDALRKRGYAFEKDLESQAVDFLGEWSGIAPKLEALIAREASSLETALRPLETQLGLLVGNQAMPASLSSRVKRLQSQVESLQDKVEAAEKNIRGGYDQFNSSVQQLQSHLAKLEWMLTEISEATFKLLATESGIMAVKAVWAKKGKKDKSNPEGVLYLTDQRIIFEQKEKIATKKVLFVATEKKLVQETLWDVPVELVENIKAFKDGFLNKDDYLELSFESRAPFDVLLLHIWQRGDDWIALIQRAKAKEFDKGRAIPVDEKVAQKVKDAPTKCPSCGGAIKQVILRGMENIHCEYCGDVIRL
jgi:predicted  nucleic acid-binding Zn-ribbon protein